MSDAQATEMRDALIELEAACDAVCALRSQEIYLSMIAVPGTPDALERLDCARRRAREIANGEAADEWDEDGTL